MTDDEKLEMLALMRQAIKEEVPPIVREIVRTETADLRADVSTLKADVASLKEKSNEFDRELSAINENVQYLIDATAREFRETKSGFVKVEAGFDKLEIRLDNLEVRIAGLERRFSSLQNQMKWVTDAILDLRADLKKHQQEHQNFLTKEELLKLESRVDRLEAQLVKLLENN
jgi:chromosome segregation ATPase